MLWGLGHHMDPAICKSDHYGLVQIPRAQPSALGQSKEQSPLSKAFQLQVRLLTLRILTQKTHNETIPTYHIFPEAPYFLSSLYFATGEHFREIIEQCS